MTPKLVFLLIGARRRVGKDTFAKFLCDEITRAGFPVLPLSFAGALKGELNLALERGGFPDKADAWTEDPELKEKVIRPLLIAWGNGMRHFNEDHWVNLVIEKAERWAKTQLWISDHFRELETPPKYVFAVVSDWRFSNEIARVRERHGAASMAIHIARPGAPEGTPDEKLNDPICRATADLSIVNAEGLDILQAKANFHFTNSILPHIELFSPSNV